MAPSTASTAAGYAEAGITKSVEEATIVCDGAEKTGGVVSTTPISKVSVVLLAASKALVAVHVTVVVPSAKRTPERGEHTGVRGVVSVSAAVTLNVTYAPTELVASAVISTAPAIVGSSAKANIGTAKKTKRVRKPTNDECFIQK